MTTTTIGVSEDTRRKAKMLATSNNTSIKALVTALIDKALAEAELTY